MIRCSHCGKLAPAGATSCQNCGMPLVSANNVAGTRGSMQQDQSELPAWLESLRAHERPVSTGSGGGDQPFSMAELVDENAMPSWMRQDQSRLAENSDAFPALSANTRPNSSPERQTFPFPANGLEANSLIDEQSLPAWMRGQDGGQPAPGQSMSANSLVQRESLPAWMKTLDQSAPQAQPPVQSQQYGLPAPQAQPPTPVQSYNLPPQAPVTPPPAANPLRQAPQTPPAYGLGQKGFSAGELVDSKSLPNWMTNGQGSPGQSPQTRPVPTERGFMAGELIDQGSLPNWMKSAQGQGNSDPVSAMGVPVTGSGSGQGTGQGILGGVGMPASSLLDMSAMPAWMRESEQGSAGAGPAMGYTPGTPQQPMAAGSLIDASTLPAWMRNADAGQSANGARAGQQPPRAESMRVPSRPRAEIVPQEQSEQAANVFSSMLGVAASSPLLPGQTQMSENNPGVIQGQQMPQQRPQQPATPVLPGWQSPQQPAQAPTLQQPQAWQMSGSLPKMTATPNTFGTNGQPGGMNSAQANYSERTGYSGIPDTNRAGTGPTTGAGNNGKGEVQTARAKKKGFFDSIRDFISK